MRTRGMNAFVKCDRRAFEGFECHCAGNICKPHELFGAMKCEGANSTHRLSAVEQRQSFLYFQLKRRDLRTRESFIRRQTLALVKDFSFADCRQRQLRQITACAHTAFFRNDRCHALLEQGVTPVIPEKGSVGASGDLAPLAHLALAAIGEGEVFYKGERLPATEALTRAQIAPLQLEVKEGLALLNGTQAMGAVGALALHRAEQLVRLADVAGAMTLEALKGTPVAFDERIHASRPHPGQLAVAVHLRELLRDSEIRKSHLNNDPRVQDAYSLRCMPQVHGAIRTALTHARQIVELESGSATDNPLVFSETGEVLSGGNFHGAPLALVFDYAAIALTDLMSITERRIDRLVNPDSNEDLPPFLTAQPGISSGFMMMQVSAAALLNEAKVLAHPASIDNVPTDGGKEDHVSMGMMAAVKLRSIVKLAEMSTAIELMTAAQGLEFHAPLAPGRGVKQAYEIVRRHVAPLTHDRAMAGDIERVTAAIVRGEFDLLATDYSD